MIIKVENDGVGRKTSRRVVVESEAPNPEQFTTMINEIKTSLSIPVREVTKIFGYLGTDQDARNFRRYMTGSRPVSWGHYQLAKQLTGRSNLKSLL